LKTGLVFAAALLAACASGPPPPDWQTDAKGALDAAVAAYLRGETRAADAEFARARGAVARTGRADLAARVELARCAAQVASVVFDPCSGFERLRADAPAAERAYADYLAGRLRPQDAGLLPPQHRAVAAADADAAVAALRGIDDPLARLVAAGVLFQSGRARPAAIAVAAETASAQGWRRPLAAWLNVQLALAERAGDAAEVQRLRRRLALVLGDH
jgi:hypothetical protein